MQSKSITTPTFDLFKISPGLSGAHRIGTMKAEYKFRHEAEIALENYMGMTYDTISGHPQISGIERNAVADVDSHDAFLLAFARDPRKQKLRLDQVVLAMHKTGHEISGKHKERPCGGLRVCAAAY